MEWMNDREEAKQNQREMHSRQRSISREEPQEFWVPPNCKTSLSSTERTYRGCGGVLSGRETDYIDKTLFMGRYWLEKWCDPIHVLIRTPWLLWGVETKMEVRRPVSEGPSREDSSLDHQLRCYQQICKEGWKWGRQQTPCGMACGCVWRSGTPGWSAVCLIFIGGKQLEIKYLFGNILKPTEKLQD